MAAFKETLTFGSIRLYHVRYPAQVLIKRLAGTQRTLNVQLNRTSMLNSGLYQRKSKILRPGNKYICVVVPEYHETSYSLFHGASRSNPLSPRIEKTSSPMSGHTFAGILLIAYALQNSVHPFRDLFHLLSLKAGQ